MLFRSRYGAEASVDLLLARGASASVTNGRNLDAVDLARAGGRDFLVERLQKSVKR